MLQAMTKDKHTLPPARATRESEIFREPPGSGNYSSSIGSAQGIEQFGESRAWRRPRPDKTIAEQAREVPVLAETDVLVVGGGPAGTAAAIAGARLGAEVLLVERYNHLGGLSTGGLVVWIDRMTDWSGRPIIRGLAEEFMERLPKDAIQGPPRADWGKPRCDYSGLLGPADRGLSRYRHLVANRRPRSAQDFVDANGW